MLLIPHLSEIVEGTNVLMKLYKILGFFNSSYTLHLIL